MYAGSSACGWRYKYVLKLMQTFYQESNSSDVVTHSPVVSESHFLNMPCPIHREKAAFGTSRGETQMFGSRPLEFLELLWTKGERPEVEQHYLFCPVSYQLFQTAPADKVGAFLVGQTLRGCRQSKENSSHSYGVLRAAQVPQRKSGPTSLQPAKEGPAARQTTTSPWHQLCLLAVSQRGRNPGPQELSRPPGSRVPCRSSCGEDAWRALAFQAGQLQREEARRDACWDFKYLFLHTLKL